MGAAHAEEVEHGGLRGEEGAAADGADFDAGHGDGDLEVAVVAVGGGVWLADYERGNGVRREGRLTCAWW